MFYCDENYATVPLIVALDEDFYRVNAFLTNGRTDFCDMFPSILMGSMLNIVYSPCKGEFIKFRYDPSEKLSYVKFFETTQIPEISMLELVSVLEEKFGTRIKIYGWQKWKTFITQE